MADKPQVTFTIELDEVEILNQIISSSTPQITFAKMAQFVNKINAQLQDSLKNAAAQQAAAPVSEQPPTSPAKQTRGRK